VIVSKILVIEDEDAVRENILELLSEEGYSVIEAPNGEDGIQKVWQEHPELVICDIMMPDLDGYGVLAKVRQDSRLSSIPFLFLTARVGRDDMRRGMGLGADDYITKPFTRQELLQAIETRLGRIQKLEALAQQKLVEVNQKIRSNLPHELLAPLSMTLNYAELLEEKAGQLTRDEQRGLARDIRHSTERLIRQVENYLLFAELDTILADPKQVQKYLQMPKLDVREILAGIAEQKAHEANRGLDLEVEVEPGFVAVSETHLLKMVEELLDNAFRYSRKGSSVMVVGTVIRAKGTYRILISDQGCGTSAERISSINGLGQFAQSKSPQDGIGLGLFLVKRLVELYHGNLRLISLPGQGTQSEIQLPLK
jgi:two-component system, sensor histidine kinase and response regulator